MTASSRRLFVISSIILGILLIPFIAMFFTDQVNWTIGDFIVGGTLLLGAGFLSELAIRKIRRVKPRAIIIMAILIALALIWAELAVGLF